MYSITTDILMEAIPKATRKSVKAPLMWPMVWGHKSRACLDVFVEEYSVHK